MREYVAHLQHGGADALGDEAGDAVFPIAGHGEAHHLRAAAGRGRARRQKQALAHDFALGHGEDHGRQRRRGDGRGQRQTEDHGDDDAHGDGLQRGGHFQKPLQGGDGVVDARGRPGGDKAAGDDGDDGHDDDVHLGLAGDEVAQFRADHGGEVGPHRAAELIAERARGGGGKHGQRRDLEAIGDGHADGRAHHRRGGGDDLAIAGEEVERRDHRKLREDQADDERGEQAQRHGAHGVEQIALIEFAYKCFKAHFPSPRFLFILRARRKLLARASVRISLCHCPAFSASCLRRRARCILPETVLGSSSTNSTMRGYL